MLGQAIGKVLLGALSDISAKLACFGNYLEIIDALMLAIKLPVLPLLLAGTFLLELPTPLQQSAHHFWCASLAKKIPLLSTQDCRCKLLCLSCALMLEP